MFIVLCEYYLYMIILIFYMSQNSYKFSVKYDEIAKNNELTRVTAPKNRLRFLSKTHKFVFP